MLYHVKAFNLGTVVLDENLHALVRKIAAKELGTRFVNDVRLVPSTDSDGRDALRLTIILNEGALDGIEDDHLVNVLVGLRRGLSEAGEHRVPVVDYTQIGDMSEDGDPQS